MNGVVYTKTYGAPPFNEKEALRYAGCKKTDESIRALLAACFEEATDKLIYKVCYRELPVVITDDHCDFGLFQMSSRGLAKNLQGCERVILLAATVGVEFDRLIAKYSRLSPAKALLLQAIGAERIEALCDTFCGSLAKETDLQTRPRFSPGYGDLALAEQKKIFSVLDCEKRIGLFLNDSLLMSPSKSVTAFMGLSRTGIKSSKCSTCDQTDCAYRGVS